LNEESKFRLLWVDEEEDEISVSSNEEFSQAIAHLEDQKNSNRLKILIRFQPKSKNLIIPAPEEIFSKRQIEKINQRIAFKGKNGNKKAQITAEEIINDEQSDVSNDGAMALH